MLEKPDSKETLEGLKEIATVDFEEIFAEWKKREGSKPSWIKLATEVKGWPDWESWRRFSMSLIEAEQRKWTTFEIIDPNSFIPEMLIGPYSGWQEPLEEKNKLTFKQALEQDAFWEKFSNHTGIAEIIKNFPTESRMIGLIRADTGQVVCLEGHHRAAAIALAQKNGQPINFINKKLLIALADLPAKEVELLDKMLVRGSAKKD